MVASASGASTNRTPSPDIEDQIDTQAEAPLPSAASDRQPVAQAYAPPQPRTIAPAEPIVATLASAHSTPFEAFTGLPSRLASRHL